MQRRLIVNADDFGQSAGINSGIMRAHDRGIVTSASLMVRWPAAQEAAQWARERPRLGLGLHCDFGEWTLCDSEWVPLYEVVSTEDTTALTRELQAQIAAFERLTGRAPTHLDSHQHVHTREPAATVLRDAAAELGIPLRHHEPDVTYLGDFYGQDAEGAHIDGAVGVEALIGILRRLPAGITELACHPAAEIDFGGLYRDERLLELETLCDPRVRRVIEAQGIALGTFAALARAGGAA